MWLDYDDMPVEKKYYKKVQSKFKSGDALIWNGTPLNKAGHVALFIAYLDDYVVVLEQDGLKQDGTHIRVRSTTNLLGALRPNK